MLHRNLLAMGDAWREEYGLADGDFTLLQIASAGFDVFTGDLARVFLHGGHMVICPDEQRLDLPALHRLVMDEGVTLFETTPAHGLAFLDFLEGRETSDLRLVILGSDALRTVDYERVLRTFAGRLRIVNSYGLTETTVDSSLYEAPAAGPLSTRSGIVPVGRPLPHVAYYVLDSSDQLTLPGVVGELCIGGRGVAAGYWRNPEETARRYVNHPEFGRIFRTGDLARWCAEGVLEWLGRKDRQVKLRGYRVELGEIESRLREHRHINDAAAVVWDSPTGGEFAAYVVCGHPLASAELATFLGERVPSYMVPQHFISVPRIPLNANGKVDSAALPRPVVAKRLHQAAHTELERDLVAIWREVLGRADIDVQTSFFELGGDSISILRCFTLLTTRLRLPVRISDLFSFPTVATLAAAIEGKQGAPPTQSIESQIKDLLGQLENDAIDFKAARSALDAIGGEKLPS